jgi:biopolymer transport protein ExbD
MDHFEEEEFARINVTPLTDVAFTLLITLMIVTAYMAIKQAPFYVVLPKVETIEERGADVVTLDIDSKGEQIAINGELVSWNDYKEILKQEALRDPYRMLLIRADENLAHGIVLRVLSDVKQVVSELKKEGKESFKKIAFGTRKKK